LRPNGKRQDERRPMDPDAIDRVVRRPAEDVQKAAGHRDRGTTKLYDRRGYNPEKAESLFATC
jgi:hypothetical protein